MTNETIATETTEAVGEFPIDELLSDGITNTPPSFVRAILKAASDPEVTSFAGGLPNPISFPQEKLLESMQRVVAERGPEAFQYSVTAGVPELRAWIADRYNHRFGTDYTEEDVLVTTGSQQVLDLLGKVLLDKGDGVIVEKPTYLAAIQAFALQQPVFREVELTEEGLNIDELNAALDAGAKMIYLIPNFQNPTGLSYSKEVHDRVVEIFKGTDIVVLEDNPYRELRFSGTATDSFGKELGEQCCMLGTFSKIVAPGMRIGWVCVRNKALREKLLSYKATADLHTNIFSQLVLAQYLADNDIDAHIEKTKVLYKHKAELMMDCMRKYLPEGVEFTPTEGGMFLWAKLPNGMSAVDLYRVALARGVAICPGDPFYEKERNVSTFRINYSNSSDEVIEKGIRILGEACAELIAKKGN